MNVNFEKLGLKSWLITVIKSFGISHPSYIQKKCIPKILKGKNIFALAQAGSGKTIAFVLPLLQRFSEEPFSIFALILSPTRETAIRVYDQFKAFSSNINIVIEIIHREKYDQSKKTTSRPNIVITTLAGLINYFSTKFENKEAFDYIKFVVLDYADNFLKPVNEKYLENLLTYIPKAIDGRRTLLFSSFITKTIENIYTVAYEDIYYFQSYKDYFGIKTCQQEYLFATNMIKELYLNYIIKNINMKKIYSCIILVECYSRCEQLDLIFKELDVSLVNLHKFKYQKERIEILRRFRYKQIPILVTTNHASYGLDISFVDLVINFDFPKTLQNYINQISKTAQTNVKTIFLNFITPQDKKMIHNIELFTGRKFKKFEIKDEEVLKDAILVCKAKFKVFSKLKYQKHIGIPN